MDVETLQAQLNAAGAASPALKVDGLPGKNTMRAVENLLKREGVRGYDGWSDARMRVAAEQTLYRKAGIMHEGDGIAVDGLVGEVTRYARDVWIARQRGDKTAETWRDAEQLSQPPAPPVALTRVSSSVWPRQSASEMDRFFGAKGTNQKTLKMPFPLRIAWEPSKQVSSFSCNARVHDPMLRIWTRTLAHYGYEEIRRLRLDMYGGCLNVRKMRGGSAWSIHSWGCAYDIDPERNQLKWKRASASLDDPPYAKFWEFVYDEGAISLGKERDYDWMHFQFARL